MSGGVADTTVTVDLAFHGPQHFVATYTTTIDELTEEVLLRVPLPGGKVHVTVTVEGARTRTIPPTT